MLELQIGGSNDNKSGILVKSHTSHWYGINYIKNIYKD
jgi:hypothetical protein